MYCQWQGLNATVSSPVDRLWCLIAQRMLLSSHYTGDILAIVNNGTSSWFLAVNYKRRAVAAQTAQSRCKVLFIQYIYYFTAYQRQRTLHGVGVITTLYFAIFVAFKESVTLNLA